MKRTNIHVNNLVLISQSAKSYHAGSYRNAQMLLPSTKSSLRVVKVSALNGLICDP
jgi:hypothetical protein